jgi:hypothetical protein
VVSTLLSDDAPQFRKLTSQHANSVLHQLDQKIIYPHYDFKHLTEKYFEIGMKLRNDETIISSISVTDIFFDVYLGKWNYRAIPKVKTWSYFLTIPKQLKEAFQEEGFSLDDLVSPTKTRGCRQGSLKILANKNSQPRY